MLPCTCPKLLGRNGEKECAQPQSTRQRACAHDLLVDEVDFPQGTTRKVNTRLRAHQRSAAGLEHAFGALCGLGVQGAGWLVQQQHRRLERDADGQRHALRLPALHARARLLTDRQDEFGQGYLNEYVLSRLCRADGQHHALRLTALHALTGLVQRPPERDRSLSESYKCH